MGDVTKIILKCGIYNFKNNYNIKEHLRFAISIFLFFFLIKLTAPKESPGALNIVLYK